MDAPVGRAHHAWWIHAGILGTLAVAFVVWAWPTWTSPPRGPLNLDGIAVAVVMVSGVGYAIVTTLIMVWAARYRWSPLLLHGISFTLFGLHAYQKHRDQVAREANYQAEHAGEIAERKQRDELRSCLDVEMVAATLAPTLHAEVTVANRSCAFPVVVGDVDLIGFKEGGNWILNQPLSTLRARHRLEPGERRTFSMDDVLPHGKPLLAGGWSWKSNVNVEEPQSMLRCFVTRGAPASEGCGAIERVTVSPGSD